MLCTGGCGAAMQMVGSDTGRAMTVIVNQSAGAKDASVASEVAELFARSGMQVEIIAFRSGEQAVTAVRKGAAAGHDAVIAAGGDGMVSAVVSGLAGSDIPLGILPLGTLNHFAKDLGVPLDLSAAVQTIVNRRTIHVDIAEVNDRIFVNNASIGIYPDVVMEREALRRRGYRKWPAFAVAIATILQNYRGLVVRLVLDHEVKTARTPFLLIGNNEYQTDGIHVGARPRLNGSRLSAYLAPRVHAGDLPRLLAVVVSGRRRRSREFQAFTARELSAEIPERRTLHVAIDGEVVRMTQPLHFRIRPLGLRVIVP